MKEQIVADGYQRAFDASFAKVRSEVEKEFAEAMAKAGFWKRILLRIRIRKEIDRRMMQVAPPWALYGRSGGPSEG